MTTDNTLPAPLVPAEVDLRDFGFMPLDVRTLLSSSLWIKAKKDPRVAHAAVSLWCEAWHQVPAGSLPDDDEVLADLARCDEKEWRRIRERALQHFVKCSDGRLYHRTVCAKAIESWAAKVARRERTKAATASRREKKGGADEKRDDQRDERRDVARDDQRDDARGENRNVHQGTVKGQGQGIEKKEGGAQSVRESPARAPEAPPDQPTPAGRIGLALRRGGLQPGQFQTSDPRVAALAEAGYTDEEVEAVAREATEKRKGFPWILATLHGRRADAQAIASGPAAAPPPDWRTDRNEVIRRGCELGIGPYQNLDHATGRSITFDAYRRRVIEADDNARNTAGSPA